MPTLEQGAWLLLIGGLAILTLSLTMLGGRFAVIGSLVALVCCLVAAGLYAVAGGRRRSD